MANLVNRATSDMLSGPDWAMNMELCDLIHNDPGLAKDSIKAVKKRLGNKNPKVQLLALTVLETMIKNCGDDVHHQVAAKDVLNEMVKIAKKNKHLQVRDKILLLLDTWQEAFGGPNGSYPQYFLAYNELRRSGAIFPRRSDSATPIFTPPQTHPIAPSFSSPRRSPNRMPAETHASRPSDLPGLSLSDIHNARSGMEVLSEMLSAIDPRNKQVFFLFMLIWCYVDLFIGVPKRRFYLRREAGSPFQDSARMNGSRSSESRSQGTSVNLPTYKSAVLLKRES